MVDSEDSVVSARLGLKDGVRRGCTVRVLLMRKVSAFLFLLFYFWFGHMQVKGI